MSDARTDEQRVEAELGHGAYGPDVLNEPTRPRDDRGDEEPGALSSTMPAGTDTEKLRNGGPTRTPGVMTTTGGNAGPNSFRPRPNRPDGVLIAPTTTGDATTGGMDTVDPALAGETGTDIRE